MSNPKSYTQWSVFSKCGAQYKYQYLERRPKPKRDESAAERGTNIHECVEAIIKGEADRFPEQFSHLDHYVSFFQDLAELGAIAELPFILDDRDWETYQLHP